MKKPQIVLTEQKISFAGNDYLGLSRDERLIEALYQSAKEYGISPTSSRWGLGWNTIFEEMEKNLTEFFGTEDATFFGIAFIGGLIYFSAMREKHDTVFCDATCHVNLFKGMSAAGYTVHKYRHLDVAHLEELLETHAVKNPIIATDGLWGISGEIPPILEISNLAKKYNAELLIDDAHGVFGVGCRGRGVAEHCGIKPEDATILGSMSKALGCNGGFLVGREELVDLFRSNEVTSGTSASAVPIIGACVKAMQIIKDEPELKDNLYKNAKRMRVALNSKGISTVDENSPIIGMVLKDEFEAAKLSEHLYKYDIAIPYFKYASEPRHELLRGIAKSCYTEQELLLFEKAIKEF
ncbi:MAG: hypothetical protein COA79_17395 [Planctomycetota bacterium]|nr:MAG: hypothetical protein COA79_17395 [Planctomycetota bacterium]